MEELVANLFSKKDEWAYSVSFDQKLNFLYGLQNKAEQLAEEWASLGTKSREYDNPKWPHLHGSGWTTGLEPYFHLSQTNLLRNETCQSH